MKTAHGPRALKAYFAANFLCYFYGNAEDVIIAFGKICTCALQSEKQSNANRISVYRQKTMSVSARAYAAPCFARAPSSNRTPRINLKKRHGLSTRTSHRVSGSSAPATAVGGLEPLISESESLDRDNARKVLAVEGVRLCRGERDFQLEYLARVEGVDVNVWVPADLIADDVKAEYESRWWQCCRQGDLDKVEEMLRGGGQALVAARDDDERSALHYACGVGSEDCVRAILANGAEVDAKDKDSFTPLHIAAGYLHEKIVEILVQSGANPELEDSTGRSPLDLVETLKLNTPATTVTFARRSVLESIAKTLEQFVFEEVPPSALKACRTTDTDQKEYLVEWLDDFSDSWVSARDISDELIDDFECGVEYAQLDKVYEPPSFKRQGNKKRQGKRERLARWSDSATPSWESSD